MATVDGSSRLRILCVLSLLVLGSDDEEDESAFCAVRASSFSRTLVLHKGQQPCRSVSQGCMQSLWNECRHLGSNTSFSPASKSSMQIEHKVHVDSGSPELCSGSPTTGDVVAVVDVAACDGDAGAEGSALLTGVKGSALLTGAATDCTWLSQFVVGCSGAAASPASTSISSSSASVSSRGLYSISGRAANSSSFVRSTRRAMGEKGRESCQPSPWNASIALPASRGQS